MMVKKTKLADGVSSIEFLDRYDKPCILLRDTLPDDAIPGITFVVTGQIHLDLDQVRWLARELSHFAEWGKFLE
jgi:hypothetical protein